MYLLGQSINSSAHATTQSMRYYTKFGRFDGNRTVQAITRDTRDHAASTRTMGLGATAQGYRGARGPPGEKKKNFYRPVTRAALHSGGGGGGKFIAGEAGMGLVCHLFICGPTNH